MIMELENSWFSRDYESVSFHYRETICKARRLRSLSHSKTGNRTRGTSTCFAMWLQNELNSDVARFSPHNKRVLQQIRLQGFFQLVMQQCCKISYIFFCPFYRTLKRQATVLNWLFPVFFFFSWAIPGQVTSSYNSVVSFFLIHSENSARVWNFMKISVLVSQ